MSKVSSKKTSGDVASTGTQGRHRVTLTSCGTSGAGNADADLLIAFLDPGVAQHNRAVDELRKRLTAGEELLVGASVYAEVIVRPLQQGTDATVDGFLEAAGVRVVPTDRVIARRAARLRADKAALRLPDALSLATALVDDAALLTLDKKLERIAQRAEQSG